MSDERRHLPTAAFQGELGAYSEAAARAYFGPDVAVDPRPTFIELFAAVVSGICSHGVVPIENSLAGSIHENYDHLLNHDVHIQGEIKLRIQHSLIVHPGVQLSELKTVHSHPQALAQCSEFTNSQANIIPVVSYDTAGSVKNLKEAGRRDQGAIAGAHAAARYGLEVLKKGIENDASNFTRFLIIGLDDVPPQEPAKTSIVFSIQNKPGALFQSIQAFSDRGINLLKIESRPLIQRPWEYSFYLDFEGHPGLPDCAEALEQLAPLTDMHRVLGSYRIGNTVNEIT
jgi:prephenate dehydratase